MSQALPRLRQLVWACASLEPADQLRELLDLGEPFADPGVVEFGLDNAVFALGDQFLEIVAPLPGKAPRETAAGRFLERSGPGGYMAIFEIADIAAHRVHLDRYGIRRVWNIDLDQIAASHLHPADVGAAIVSIDQPVPPGSWLWAGPDWRQRSRPGKLNGARVTSSDPEKIADRWGTALDTRPEEGYIPLDEGRIAFETGEQDRLTGFGLAVGDKDEVLRKARHLGLLVDGDMIRFEGVELTISEA